MVALDGVEPAKEACRPRSSRTEEPKDDPQIPVPLRLQAGRLGPGIGRIEVVVADDISVNVEKTGLRLRRHLQEHFHIGLAGV